MSISVLLGEGQTIFRISIYGVKNLSLTQEGEVKK